MKKSISFHKTGASRLLSLLLTVCLMVSLFAMPTYAAEPQPTAAKTGFVSQGLSTTGTTYFVDAGEGDDANTGKSADAAWKSLDKVSASTFKPGDHILLRAGSTWNGQMLYPKGSGSKGEPIIIDIYDVDSKGKAIFTADARPIINGNGTEGIGSKKTMVSGAVMTYNQEFIEIYNLEVTNSEDLSDTDAYLKPGKTQRAGILAYSDNQTKLYEHIVIKDCYVHDVQSEFFEKSNDKTVGGLKAVGGIIVLGHFLTPEGVDVCPDSTHRSKAAYKDVLIEGNTVKRVGLEGIRTKAQGHSNNNTFYKVFENVTIRNNYLEDIAGDGIVLTEVKTNGLVENNIAKQPCNADYGTKNYAGIWSMFADDTVFQHNENYGIVYGYNDGEAYDIDMSCDNNIYQYNYSHHNNGGFLLFMGDQRNSIVRYNISANDGGGNAGTCSSYPAFGFKPYTYKEQSIFHYWNKADNANMPTIYNNTFYIGDGISTSLYGEGNSSSNEGVISRFYNNIIYKDGAGTFKFLANQPSDGADPTERKLAANPEKFIKNNLIWPESIASVTSGTTVAGLEASGNIFAQPKLKLDDNKAANLNALAAQKNTAMDSSKDNIYDYTSTAALRARADMFKISDTSPAIAKGMQVAGAPKEDFFGNTITNKVPDIGAHQISNVISSTEATSVAAVNVTTLAGIYPVLPSKVTVTFTDTLGTQTSSHDEERSVVWDNIKAEDINKSGTITVSGTVAGISIKASATVTVNGDLGTGNFTQNFSASADAYMERGKKKDTALGDVQGTYSVLTDSKEIVKSPLKTSFSNNYVVKIKNATASDYNRRFVTSFDVSAFTGVRANIKNASIKLHISRYDVFNNNINSTARFLDVYAIPSANTWDESTVTWNNMAYNIEVNKNHPSKDWINNKKGETEEPTYGEIVPVAHKEYINSDIIANDDTIEIDVTEYIRTLDPSITTVSFLVDSPYSKNEGHDVDNGGFDAFSKEGAKAAYDAFKANALPEGITVASETSLAPQLMISDVYPTGIVPIEVDTKLGVAPVLPTTATVNYSDSSTKTVSITWDSIDPAQYGAEGEFTVSGRSAAVSVPIEAKVTVTALKIVSFDQLADIYMPTGLPRNELGLATSATALLDNGSRVSVNIVSWNDSAVPYVAETAGEYVFAANIELPAGVLNPNSAKPGQKVTTSDGKIVDVSVSPKKTYVAAGTTKQFAANVAAIGTINKDVVWSASGNATATTIDATGLLTVPEGEVDPITVTATSLADGTKLGTAEVVLSEIKDAYVSDVVVAPKYAEVAKGEAQIFTVAVSAENAADTSVDWVVEGATDAATVIGTDGALTIGKGETAEYLTVKATSKYTLSDNATVKVKAYVPKEYTITADADKNGTVTPATQQVTEGGEATVTVTPNEGYVVDKVLVDAAEVTLQDGKYVFTNVQMAHMLNATFKARMLNITATAGANGTISPATSTVPYGTSQTFTITPNAEYAIDTVLVNNTPITVTSNTLTLNGITQDNTTVAVTFKKVTNDVMQDPTTGTVIEANPGVIANGAVFEVTQEAQDSAVALQAAAKLSEVAENLKVFTLSLKSGGVEINPNGALRVSLSVSPDFDINRFAIYRVNSISRKARAALPMYEDMKAVVANGKATFTTTSLGVFAIVEKKAEVKPEEKPAEKPNTDNTNTTVNQNNVPKTGDSYNIYAYIILLIVSIIGIISVGYIAIRKRIKNK